MKPISVYLLATMLLCLTACKKDLFDHNIDQSLEANLQQLADAYTEQGLPGVVLVVETPNEGTITLVSGYSDLEKLLPLSPDFLFHSASLMKPYTATCVFMLEEAGLLRLEDRISQYLDPDLVDQIPNGQDATLLSLLNHSSGIPDFTNQPAYLDDLFAFAEGGPEPLPAWEYIQGMPASFAVGKRHEYSNTGYYLLSRVVEAASGKTFANYLHESIILGLGLKATFYGDLPTPLDYNLLPQYYIDWEDDGQLSLSTELEQKASQTFEGMGGLVASPGDYHQFIKALFSGELISQASLDKMMTHNHTKQAGYGQGLEVILSSRYPDKFGHKGGTQASFFYYPAEETYVLSFINYSFNTGNSPFDSMGLVPDKIGQNKNLIGEIERCLFEE